MTAAFDRLAAQYDELWTNAPIGRLQREAVWRGIGQTFRRGHKVLDLGCGTGEDALRLAARGVRVTAIDASPEMVRVARERGVSATVLPVERLKQLEGRFDGALSNFGVLNCVPDLAALRAPLSRLIRPGGTLAICMIGRFCLWETLHYLRRGDVRKAARRWTRAGTATFGGTPVFYPSVRQVRRALAPEFRLVRAAGIGILVPPSYVQGVSKRTLERFDAVDRRIANTRLGCAIADHRLLMLVRS